MKKFTTLFLVLAFTVLSLVGCSNATTNVKSTETTTQSYQSEPNRAAQIDNFITECIEFIDTGKCDEYLLISNEELNISGIDSRWMMYVTTSLNAHISSLEEDKKPYFYSIEMLKDDKYFQISIHRSLTSDLQYYFDSWSINIGDVYVYVTDKNLYQEMNKQLDNYTSSLSNKEQLLMKDKIDLILCK